MSSRSSNPVTAGNAEHYKKSMGEKEPANSNDLYKVVFDSINDAVAIIDADFRITRANRVFLDEVGLEMYDVVGRTCYEVTHRRSAPCAPPNEQCPLRETLETGGYSSVEHVHFGKGGEKIFVEVSTSPIKDRDGSVGKVVYISRNITERKLSEESIRASLEEKEVLLKEVHHRVKNNLQIISSLLSLQSSYIKDEESLHAFRESQNRIRSMAIMHEHLYQSRDMARVSFKEYIERLLRDLSSAYGMTSKISIHADVEDVRFGVDTAIPCGLAVNELLSNAIRHAFPGEREGRVDISFRATDDSEYEMVVRDNGVGMPVHMDYRNAGSLGLRLVSTLVEGQLEGSLEVRSSKGTEVRFRFREQGP